MSTCPGATITESEPGIGGGVVTVIIIAFLCAYFTCLCMVMNKLDRKTRHKARQPTPPTDSPRVPEWVQKAQKTYSLKITQLTDRLKFYTAPYEVTGIFYLQHILNDIYEYNEGRKFIKIGGDTCLIQIAKPGFKCARKPAEFFPIKGAEPHHHYTYQMFGEDAIQATWLHLEHRKILAGITIYINTYSEYRIFSGRFSKSVLWNLLVAEHIFFPDQAPNEVPTFPDPEAITKSLITNFCKALKRPVMLYEKDGLIVHMEWDREHNTFQYVECGWCHKDMEEQDKPPSYQIATHHLLSEC